MTKLSDPIVIRGNRIKNRIVMEPLYTFSFHGDNGSFYGREHVEHYTARAKGGAGLVIVQASFVFGAAASTERWTAADKAALRLIAENCHECGAVAMMQLACGHLESNVLSLEDIDAMQKDMVAAAETACSLGFDGAEFHFAHGFTLCRFLDAAHNTRTDRFGGSLENRMRILTDLLPEIRQKTHERFILGVRMGEYLPGESDGIEAARAFEKAGIDLINVSFGMETPKAPVPDGFPLSPVTLSGCRLKRAVGVPVIAVDGIKTASDARYLVENDLVDFAGIGRGMLADPQFANHVLSGEPVNVCRSCKRCLWFTDHTKCPARKALSDAV